jgi:hypothetical protein
MRKFMIISILPLLLLCMAFRLKVEGVMTIEEAVKQGLVKVKVNGKGGHSGECVILEIQNLKKKDLKLMVEAGRRLNSSDEGEQDLLVVRDQNLIVQAGAKKKINMDGFCCQLSNRSPGLGSGFTLGTLADEKLVKLAQYINGKSLPEDVIQEAVWCISDKENPSNISVEEDAEANAELQKKVSELRKFTCALMGVEDKWYSTPQKRIETPERQIQSNPVEIYGAIKYVVKTKAVINSELQDENHKTIFSMPGKNTMEKGEWDYNFHLKLDGFAKGTYHVILKAGTVQIMDREFTIS